MAPLTKKEGVCCALAQTEKLYHYISVVSLCCTSLEVTAVEVGGLQCKISKVLY